MNVTYRDMRNGLVGLAEQKGFTVARDLDFFSFLSGAAAQTDWVRHHIELAPKGVFDEEQDTWNLAHEVGHALLHGDKDPAVIGRDRGELEAEATALLTFRALHVPIPEGQGQAYIIKATSDTGDENWETYKAYQGDYQERGARYLWEHGSKERATWAAEQELKAIQGN